MRGSISIEFDKGELNRFNARCQMAIRNVARGTKTATEQACKDILAESLRQVPRDTDTLAASAFYKVYRRTDTAETYWAYEGIVGYGGNGNPINPKTGEPVSAYMVAVHERMDVNHPIGKAKFLEDPVREYAAMRFHRTVFTHAKNSLASMSD